ncbi:MAG: hypothetical protein ACREOF_06760 [Gemmatimonadales bacterium]
MHPEPGSGGHSDPPAYSSSQRKRPPASVGTRKPLDFDIPESVIQRLAGGRRANRRRLTAVKGPKRESLDPVVQRALERVEEKYSGKAEELRSLLADRYLEEAEAVTARLNKKALPELTRALLAVDGVYEQLLIRAIEAVGGETAHADTYTTG